MLSQSSIMNIQWSFVSLAKETDLNTLKELYKLQKIVTFETWLFNQREENNSKVMVAINFDLS